MAETYGAENIAGLEAKLIGKWGSPPNCFGVIAVSTRSRITLSSGALLALVRLLDKSSMHALRQSNIF